jgi:hypothetical protein
MKLLLGLTLGMFAFNTFAAQYSCTVTSTRFANASDLEKVQETILIDSDKSMDVKSKVFKNGRKAKMTVLTGRDNGKTFQLQLFEDKEGKKFITYVATTVWEQPNEVSAKGQHFDKSTAKFEEYSFKCN